METHAHTLREIAEQSHPGETREALLSAATEIDRQAERIRELEGALRDLLTVVHDEADDIDEEGGVCVYAFAADIENARRILEGGKP